MLRPDLFALVWLSGLLLSLGKNNFCNVSVSKMVCFVLFVNFICCIVVHIICVFFLNILLYSSNTYYSYSLIFLVEMTLTFFVPRGFP